MAQRMTELSLDDDIWKLMKSRGMVSKMWRIRWRNKAFLLLVLFHRTPPPKKQAVLL